MMPVTTPTKSPSPLLNGGRSYMSGTQSSEAKVRSQSAPKQRPEQGGARKRAPLSEVILEASRASLGGTVGMHNNRVQQEVETFSFKKAVMSRFDRSSTTADQAAERDRDMFLHKAW